MSFNYTKTLTKQSNYEAETNTEDVAKIRRSPKQNFEGDTNNMQLPVFM